MQASEENSERNFWMNSAGNAGRDYRKKSSECSKRTDGRTVWEKTSLIENLEKFQIKSPGETLGEIRIGILKYSLKKKTEKILEKLRGESLEEALEKKNPEAALAEISEQSLGDIPCYY